MQLGFRGGGIERRLLEALEQAARRNKLKMLWAEVMPDNVRSLGLFGAHGYQRATEKDLAGWPGSLKARMLPGRVVMMKLLD